MGTWPLSYLAVLALAAGVEAPVVALFYPGRRLRMALACILATIGTHLLMTFGLPRLVAAPGLWLLLGESLALVLEAAVYLAVDPQREAGRALLASSLANCLSYLAGRVLL